MAKLALVRFSLLSLSTYNKKKLLNILNIGIFISIFALSASFLSIFFENKIDMIEKKILSEQINKIIYNDTLSQTAKHIKNTDSILDNNIKETGLKLLIKESFNDAEFMTSREIYYSKFFILENKIELNNLFIDNSLKNAILVANSQEDLKLIKTFRKKYKTLKKTENEITFMRNSHDYENEPSRDSDNNFIYKDNELQDWYRYYKFFVNQQIELIVIQKSFLYDFNINYFSKKNNEYDQRKNKNLEIIEKNSKIESRAIFIAFAIQLFIFLISQFFEFTLDNFIRRKKNAKRK